MGACQLCQSAGGEVLWEDDRCRVVRVEGAEGVSFPGYCRVVWRGHVAEMSDLAAAARDHLMRVVLAVETALRALVAPDKINLAALGNIVPHLHWHVIPRWRDDSHFPAAIWSSPQRPVPPRPAPASAALRHAIAEALATDEVKR
jgi:diadenosine tetraphosphate (Ap4A) HIT family hydrolase